MDFKLDLLKNTAYRYLNQIDGIVIKDGKPDCMNDKCVNCKERYECEMYNETIDDQHVITPHKI